MRNNKLLLKKVETLTQSVDLSEYRRKCEDYFSIDKAALQKQEQDLQHFQYNSLKNLPPNGFCNLQLYDINKAKSQIVVLDKYQQYKQDVDNEYNILMTETRLQNKALRDRLFNQYVKGQNGDISIDDL